MDCQKEYPICENCGSHVMENGCECGEYTGLKRGWPWDHFPEDRSTWDECVRQYRTLKDKVTEYECRNDVEFKACGFTT